MRGAAKRKWSEDWHLSVGNTWEEQSRLWLDSTISTTRGLIQRECQSPCEVAFAEAILLFSLMTAVNSWIVYGAEFEMYDHRDAFPGSEIGTYTNTCHFYHCGFASGRSGTSKLLILFQPLIYTTNWHPDFVLIKTDDSLDDGFSADASSIVAVEIDGHDFHERTKEQASRDRERDREHLAIGIRTIRFTGSDVYRDPQQCVFDAMRFIGLEDA